MVYLHIGRHRTGTSALQRFLSHNRAALASLGFEYPEPLRVVTGRGKHGDFDLAHHDLATGVNPKRMARAGEELRAAATAEVERMRKLLGERENVLLSSEAFQDANPAHLERVFPIGDTTVIVYLREQLDYLLSAYAQWIQAEPVSIPFVDFASGFRPDYSRFLGAWSRVFGDRLRVRVYDRRSLVGGDIRYDFLRLLGIERRGFTDVGAAETTSMSPELIEFRGVVNAFVPPDVQQKCGVTRFLFELAPRFTTRIRVSPDFAERYRAQFRASNEDVTSRYFGDDVKRFPEKDLAGEPAAVDPFEATHEVLQAIAELSPETARTLRAYVPADRSQFEHEPLLPTDWAEATRLLRAPSGQRIDTA